MEKSTVKRIKHNGGIDRLIRESRAAKDLSVTVGFQGASGRESDGGVATVAQIAFWNEFGTSRIPERPFIRRVLSEDKAAISSRMAKEAKKVISGGQTMKQAVKRVGIYVAARVQVMIANSRGWATENAKRTVLAKKSDQPLVSTGHMAQRVSSAVREGGSIVEQTEVGSGGGGA